MLAALNKRSFLRLLAKAAFAENAADSVVDILLFEEKAVLC